MTKCPGWALLFGPEGRWNSVDTVEELSSIAAEALAYLGATGICGGTLAAMVYDPDEDPDADAIDDPTTYDDNMLQLVAWHAPAVGGRAGSFVCVRVCLCAPVRSTSAQLNSSVIAYLL